MITSLKANESTPEQLLELAMSRRRRAREAQRR
jgi:hypothetical protein